MTAGSEGTVFAGKDQVDMFVLIVLKNGISLYLKTGMKPNRAWTPTAMRIKATSYTGIEYARSRKGLERALAHLEELTLKATG
jgi:hypothetical protein